MALCDKSLEAPTELKQFNLLYHPREKHPLALNAFPDESVSSFFILLFHIHIHIVRKARGHQPPLAWAVDKTVFPRFCPLRGDKIVALVWLQGEVYPPRIYYSFFTTDHSIAQPINHPTNHPINRPPDRRTAQATDRPIAQPHNSPPDFPTDRMTDRSTDQPPDRPTDRPTVRPTAQSTNRP